MFGFLIVIAFLWLMMKAIGLVFKVTWGLAKIVAGALMLFSLPLLIVCFLFWSGIVLALPLILLGIAFVILKTCT
jgi:hypothetical protein